MDGSGMGGTISWLVLETPAPSNILQNVKIMRKIRKRGKTRKKKKNDKLKKDTLGTFYSWLVHFIAIENDKGLLQTDKQRTHSVHLNINKMDLLKNSTYFKSLNAASVFACFLDEPVNNEQWLLSNILV